LRIAINTRLLLSSKMEGLGWYTYEVAKRLVEQHPEHQFFFFFDRPYDKRFIFGKNITPVVLNPPARHPILFYIWFEWSVKRALKKHKIDLFFSPDGYLSLGSNVRQISVLHDLNYEHRKEDLPATVIRYLHYFFPRFANKAEHIITVSEYSRQDIIKTYNIPPAKITAIWNGASDAYKPLSTEEKQKTKDKYTDGEDYFLFVGALHPRKNLIRLVQAFEVFKKETKSPTKLLIVGEFLWKNKKFKASVPNSNESEIKFTGHLPLEELILVMGSAKLFTFVPYFEGFGIPMAEAMKCGTPILSGNLTSLPEVGGNAVEYCNPFDVQDISKKMVKLDADNSRLQELSTLGLQRSVNFSWDTCAKEVAKVLGL
jgi:glycosyltransferase involved in cell wall biosynthesis